MQTPLVHTPDSVLASNSAKATSYVLAQSKKQDAAVDFISPPFKVVSFVEKPLPFTERTAPQNSGPFVILLLCLAIWTLLKASRTKRLELIVESFINNRFVSQLIREEGLLRSEVNLALLISGILIYSLSLWVVLNFFGIFPSVFSQFWLGFLYCTLGFTTLFLLKIAAISLGNIALQVHPISQEYFFNVFIYTEAFGFIAFPLLLVGFFTSWLSPMVLAYTLLAFMTLFFVWRISKTFVLGLLSTPYSVFYIIVYLCSFEIIPVLVIARLIFNVIY